MFALRRSFRFRAGTGPSVLSLRFLIDNALRPQLADLLRAEGYNAVHVRGYRMHAAKDEEIVERAIEEDRIVVSADSDFSAILAVQERNAHISSSSGNRI